MPLYKYKAVNEERKTVSGTVERNNAEEVTEYLIQKGLYPLKVREQTLLDRDISDILKKPISLKSLALFCRQLSFFMESGVLLPRALEIMSAQSKDRRVQRMLIKINRHSSGGKSLSECLRTAPVPPLLPIMCRIGEESSKLDESIEQMAEYYEKEYKDNQAVTSALIYPLILVVMMIAVLIMSIVFVIPNYAAIFAMEGIALPLPTQIMLSIGDFVADHNVLIIITVFGLIVAAAAFFNTQRGKAITGFIKLRLPLWRLGMSLCYCKCMSMLLSSGMPIPEALMITYEAIGNVYLSSTFNNMCTGLKQGRKLSAVMSEAKCFDIMLINMIEIGEETGSLSKPISQCAEYYQSERERASDLITKLAEPVIMLVLGGVLALIMLSVILPTFELVNAF